MLNEAEIREIRATITEILDPLYAARLHNIPYHIAAEMAIARLQALDRRFLKALHALQARPLPPEEAEAQDEEARLGSYRPADY